MEEKIAANVRTFGSLLPGEYFICIDDMTNGKGVQEYRVSSLKRAEVFRHGILGGSYEQTDFPPGKLVLRIRP